MRLIWGDKIPEISGESKSSASGPGIQTPGTQTKVILQQIKAITRLTPALMVANLFFMVALLSTAYSSISGVALISWLITLGLFVSFNFIAWYFWPAHKGERPSVEFAANFILISAVLYGGLWGALPLLTVGQSNPTQLLYMGTIIAGVVCGAGFSLAVMPRAMIAFLVPLIAGSLLAAIIVGSNTGILLVAMLMIFTAVLAYSGRSYTISQAKRINAQEQLKDQKAVISLLLKDFEDKSSDWLWETNELDQLINVSERFLAVTELTEDKLAGMNVTSLAAANSDELNLTCSAFIESIRNRLTFRDLTVPVLLKGSQHWWSITGKPTYDSEGNYTGYRGVCSDISDQKRSEERVKFLAHNDALTGLVNRTQFTERLNQHVARLERFGTPFSVHYIDLDHFKVVNDTKGHPIGDKLLTEIGKRLRAESRKSDVLARIGGDEFAIIADHCGEENSDADLAQRVIDTLSVPFEIDGHVIIIGASVGIAKAPLNGTRPDQILRNADLALYRAKEEGKGVFQFFQAEMDADARERRALEFELREALENNEFELHYQPLLDVETEKPSGFEALIRWNHPIRDQISPAEFIPLAEKIGLINSIGEWVINEACITALTWPDKYTVAVNLSAHQFEKGKIVDVVKEALNSSGLDPKRLELEVTESLLIDNPDQVIEILMELKELGVVIAMDDFGTGYSSLSYLMKFPFDKMKIDRSFVVALDTDSTARDILKTIGSLGESLNMKITVEGVETSEQVEFLSNVSCHLLQGYYFARPLKGNDVSDYLDGYALSAPVTREDAA